LHAAQSTTAISQPRLARVSSPRHSSVSLSLAAFPPRASPPSESKRAPAMAGRRASPDVEAVAVIVLAVAAAAILSPAAAAAAGNFTREVRVLRAVKAALRDPGHVLGDWDVAKSGHNPCNWSMVHCCHHGRLVKLNLEQKNLSGRLSPAIGRLTTLRFLSLSQNAISGPIPETIGGMDMLQRLDLSNNRFNGSIPSTLGSLLHLQYLKLNNNSLSGPIPDSLTTARKIFRLDLSFNNLSGSRPMSFHASIVTLEGNPLLSGINCTKGEPGVGYPLSGGNCSYVTPDLAVLPPPILSPTKMAAVVCLVTACITGAVLLFYRGRQPQQVFAVVDGNNIPSSVVEDDVPSAINAFIFGNNSCYDIFLSIIRWYHMLTFSGQNGPVGHLGHLKQYKLDEIQKATGNFCRENILGEGAFGIVYKGGLPDGSIVAVKRLKGRVSDVGDDQFHTEVEVISLIAHRNLLRLLGFCTTDDERILVYPYMPNGTVASKLQEQVDGEPALDWPRRKMVALGTAQGLLYLHEHCDPKIIHRDIKASNVLLDEYLEAVVADFGLAKLVDHGVSHIVTLVRGTIGRIPPEAVMVGHSSEKTDIFGFGLLLMEIVTGRKTLELHENEHEEGGILELAKELLEQNQLNSFVDRRLRDNYDSAELEKMVQIAMLCTMYNPDHRPRMSEVVRMLKGGDGVSEKWEALKNVEEPISPFPEFQLDAIDYDSDQRSSVELQACELSGPR
ncbi:hypothetical protein EJB05_33352, partial [Eragrostis curvula]